MGGHYDRAIFKQLEENISENDKLKKEIKQLKDENKRLVSENKRLACKYEKVEKEFNDFKSNVNKYIENAVKEAIEEAKKPLLEKIDEKDAEIKRLKAQINKDSSNSSKPSGSNGFKKIPNNREKSTKKQGGQYGHCGSTLSVPKNLDELVAAGKAKHIVLSDVKEGESYISDWTVDINVIPVYTEHRRKGENLPKVEYGSNIKAISIYLSNIGLVPYKRLSQFFCDVSHGLITISKAVIAKANHEAAKLINMESYVKNLLNGKVIHVDETPIRTSERINKEGELETAKRTTFQAYIRTYSNEKTTILTAASYKTEESVRTDNILTQFHGIISQDHETKFYKYGDKHATCGAHLTRELKGLAELQMLPWGNEVREFFIKMNKQKNEDVRMGKISCGHDLLCSFENKYDELLKKGKKILGEMKEETFGYNELRRMVNRLENNKDNYMLFIRDYDAPFTNNEAERDLRHCKTKQKISGCYRTWQGVIDYCKIRSMLATTAKRGEDLFNTILSTLTKNPLPAGQ